MSNPKVATHIISDLLEQFNVIKTQNARDAMASYIVVSILAQTTEGAKLRTNLGVEVTRGTKMGKNIKSAMEAYTKQ